MTPDESQKLAAEYRAKARVDERRERRRGYAAAALTGILARGFPDENQTHADIAELAFDYADAMLAEEEK